MVVTGERDGFPVRPEAYYRDVLETFRRRGQAELLLAEFEGMIVAGLMVFAYGPEGIYMYGASSNQHRREMPTYLLQWRAIQWCMAKGCTRYDLWGIPEEAGTGADAREELEDKNVRTGLWGVYRFKQGFGGTATRYTGAYDYPYIRPLYLAWSHLRKSREL
jgi:lipid II:glycine glycyltransferase (peptidoglycan interpeptide bridge formation enzyme)